MNPERLSILKTKLFPPRLLRRNKSTEVDDQISEFREWISPRIDSIEDHPEFSQRVQGYKAANSILNTLDFSNSSVVEAAEMVASSCLDLLASMHIEEGTQCVADLINYIYALTGTTDNNVKCQFAPFLRHVVGLEAIPIPRRDRGGKYRISIKSVDELGQYKLASLSSHVTALACRDASSASESRKAARTLLSSYIYCIFDCGNLVRLIDTLKSFGKGINVDPILEVLATYQLRGSTAAIAGHGPETSLRNVLSDIGMVSGIEYNDQDVIPDTLLSNRLPNPGMNRAKTRAYDFVIPYRLDHIKRKIFIQSQIYAGDSGSVSHKNVDQIPLSRREVEQKFEDPVFLEYLDGAGYYTALGGDLRRILQMKNTHGFFQLRTCFFLLPQMFREIGLLFPADLIGWYLKNCIFGNPSSESLDFFLARHYHPEEIYRNTFKCLEYGFDISEPDLEQTSQDMLVISTAIVIQDAIDALADNSRKHEVAIPGVPGYGISLGEFNAIRTVIEKVIPSMTVSRALDYLQASVRAIKFTS